MTDQTRTAFRRLICISMAILLVSVLATPAAAAPAPEPIVTPPDDSNESAPRVPLSGYVTESDLHDRVGQFKNESYPYSVKSRMECKPLRDHDLWDRCTLSRTTTSQMRGYLHEDPMDLSNASLSAGFWYSLVLWFEGMGSIERGTYVGNTSEIERADSWLQRAYDEIERRHGEP